MMNSVSGPKPQVGAATRRNSITVPPALPPRHHSLSTTPAAQTAKLQVTVTTLPLSGPKTPITNTSTSTSTTTPASAMEYRFGRPSSPRRHANPARSSTGTFQDPYYNTYYARPSSPRSSGERVGGSHHQSTYYSPSSPRVVTTSSSYGRPRRNTGESTARPSSTSMPIRTPYTPHGHLDRPSSPLAQSWDKRGDTYISHGPSRSTHKKIYSVDDATHSAQLVAATDVESHRHRDSFDRGYTTSGSRTYHGGNKAPPRLTDLGDDGYSYTDPASMYRDTEPAWRRPRAGSLERSSRPTSMIVDRPPRSSARELGPPPSTRGFDKINNGVPRAHGRSSSIDRSRDIPKYDPYPDATPARSSSTRNHAPAIHQEPRRDTYHDSYDRRDRELENRRHNSVDRYEDPHVSSRGFGIATGPPPAAHDYHPLDRQPLYSSQDAPPARADDYGAQYHSSHRADARMPEPRAAADPRSSESRVAESRSSRDAAPIYDKQPRESSKAYVPALAAGAVTGAAATLGAAGYMKSRDRDQDTNSSEERERERERERRREQDERDRRDKYDDRREERRERRADDRERRPEERRDIPPPSTTPVNPPYPAAADLDKKPRERRYDDEERSKSSRKAPSSEGSGDERTRHYVDRDAERRKDAAPAPAALDPDEEYRRRVQQEAERSRRADRDRDSSDSDRERRRRKDDRSRSRGPESQNTSRRDERSSSVYDSNLTQEPESMDKLNADQPNKQVTIVAPPKEAPLVKGILRKPTEKFPEDPEPIREGVAPHKDALKGKDIPVGARWTRIDRRLVNPEALEEAKERFEERMDCVIVLRVLTKQEIQKLADRTRKIRERREDEYERRSKDDRDDEDRDRDRDRERGRDRDRERRRRYDDEESDYEDLARHHDRERDRDRDRPKMLEPAR